MLKCAVFLILIISTCLVITSCRAEQTAVTTVTAPLTETAIPPSPPANTPEVAPSRSPTPEVLTEPAPTTAPETPATASVCFTPADLIPIAFMPEGDRLLVRTGSGVQIFNLVTMQEESFFKAPMNVLAAALSPDGSTLAWSLEDHTIQLLRIADQKLINTLPGHADVVYKLRFSPSGDRLISASHDTWVRIWDLEGNLLYDFQPDGEVLGIGISPDDKQLATIPFDGPLKLWDLVDHKLIAELGSATGYDTSDAVFSPDGRYLAADLATGLNLWSLPDGELSWDKIKNSMAVAFSPDGRYLAYSDIDENNDIILSSPDGSQVVRTLEGIQAPVWEMFFSPDSTNLVTADGVGLRVWSVEDGKLLYIGKYACP